MNTTTPNTGTRPNPLAAEMERAVAARRPTKPESPLEICGYCGGQGWRYGPIYDNHGYQRHDEAPRETCEYCGGTGQCPGGSTLMPAMTKREAERA